MFMPRMLMLISLISAGALTRFIPHWWNFTAIGAMCLFGGAYFRSKWVAFLLPLSAIALSDLMLSVSLYGLMGFGANWFEYICFSLTVLLGMLLRERVTVKLTTAVAMLASFMFFLLSNFHVWLQGDLYPHTLAGLIACYTAAIPFALNMLWGNLFYCGVMFGICEELQHRWPIFSPIFPRSSETPVAITR